MPKLTVALVTGCFDLLHYGHFKFLKFAKSKANILIVGLESDYFIKEHKNSSRPLFPQKIRKYCLQNIKSVDKIFLIPNHANYTKLLQKINPDFLIISSNDSKYKEKHQICQQLGIKLIIFPRLKNYSTSKIISLDIAESH